MATITGFTAERMLTIENETVIDGEVRDTNLFLIRRDGVEIDAGWVKGAPGGMGPQGSPGVIQSINDEVKPFAYSPRVFDTKADLNAWGNAPFGSVGIVRDDSQTIWQKDTAGWFLVNGVRIFGSVTERDLRWLNPPDGSICQAPVGTEWRRIAGVWKDLNWNLPRGYVGQIKGPASDISGSNPIWTVGTFPVVANRRYRASGFARASSTGTYPAISLRLIGWSEVPANMMVEDSVAANGVFAGTAITYLMATATGQSPTISIQAVTQGKIYGGSGLVLCEDIGGY